MASKVTRTFILAVTLAIPLTVKAQQFSGLVYTDYSYLLQSETGENEGENGFGFRRLYLTGDYDISDDFSVRARLEANDGSTTAQGKPAPFVKDLYLTWKGAIADGHDIQIGITSPPSFTVSEKYWGYRSLEKTIQDLQKVVSSRDFGVVMRGPLTSTGSVRYGVMVANNSGGSAESNKNKRVYAQLEFYPNAQLAVTVGGDYASLSGDENGAINGNAFVGYTSGVVTVGVEGFYNQLDLDDASVSNIDTYGVSLFARAEINEKVEVVGRFDRSTTDVGAASFYGKYGVAGVALRPHPNVRVIPNLLIGKDEGDEQAFVTGRITLHADF